MKQDRREFLIKSCGALSTVAIATQMRHFGLMSAEAQKVIDDSLQPDNPSDYRALVCVFMQGGNDGNNTVIPNFTQTASVSNYTDYYNARNPQGLALVNATSPGMPITGTSIFPTRMPGSGTLEYALHPGLGPQPAGNNIVNNGIHELWGLGKMAVVCNVGTLVQPTTRANYNSVVKPFQLFSHSDQVSQYQGGRSDTQSFTGWAGRISDSRQGVDNVGALVPMVTSIAGAQLFTSGLTTLPLAIADSNTLLNAVLNPAGYGTNPQGSTLARLTAFNSLRGMDLSNQYVSAASNVTELAMQANSKLQSLVTVSTQFPNTSIGRQLKQVALMIKKRTDLLINRQVFYVQLGSFDTHSGQVSTQNTLLVQMSQAMRAFYQEMVAQNIGDKVTQFTMADFSRTLNPAGTGSGTVGTDHAWGNHMFVVGGGITAANFYGNNGFNGTPYPQLEVGTKDDADSGSGARGRWIPATSVDEYAATLARWYGVPSGSMASVFPKITNFAAGVNTDLGFLQPPAPSP
ncbi:MAG TPA: DUF1501 domain-containing protein [Pyrinomonadaceae bacterium]|jgi:uncharacterized protein (DUF1501 family)|nr:DUF1501 domain-containing protein [Pyrinomonadaceae bacterium]